MSVAPISFFPPLISTPPRNTCNPANPSSAPPLPIEMFPAAIPRRKTSVSTLVVPILNSLDAASWPSVYTIVPPSANFISASLPAGAFINCLTSPEVVSKCSKSKGLSVPIPT